MHGLEGFHGTLLKYDFKDIINISERRLSSFALT